MQQGARRVVVPAGAAIEAAVPAPSATEPAAAHPSSAARLATPRGQRDAHAPAHTTATTTAAGTPTLRAKAVAPSPFAASPASKATPSGAAARARSRSRRADVPPLIASSTAAVVTTVPVAPPPPPSAVAAAASLATPQGVRRPPRLASVERAPLPHAMRLARPAAFVTPARVTAAAAVASSTVESTPHATMASAPSAPAGANASTTGGDGDCYRGANERAASWLSSLRKVRNHTASRCHTDASLMRRIAPHRPLRRKRRLCPWQPTAWRVRQRRALPPRRWLTLRRRPRITASRRPAPCHFTCTRKTAQSHDD